MTFGKKLEGMESSDQGFAKVRARSCPKDPFHRRLIWHRPSPSTTRWYRDANAIARTPWKHSTKRARNVSTFSYATTVPDHTRRSPAATRAGFAIEVRAEGRLEVLGLGLQAVSRRYTLHNISCENIRYCMIPGQVCTTKFADSSRIPRKRVSRLLVPLPPLGLEKAKVIKLLQPSTLRPISVLPDTPLHGNLNLLASLLSYCRDSSQRLRVARKWN